MNFCRTMNLCRTGATAHVDGAVKQASRARCVLVTVLLVVLLTSTLQSVIAQQPNILLIVLDDAGYSDIGVFGGEIATPNIDQLANEGMLFTQFHVTPNCSSTRASLLTGMDHHLTGLGTHGVTADNQKGKAGYEGYLNNRVITLPEVLGSAGYRTMMTGKWHLGSSEPATWPSSRGFDDSFVLLNGGASHWEDNLPLFPSKPSRYVDNGRPLDSLPKGFYSSDDYTDRMLGFIDRSEAPFFAYLAFTAPHNPLHAPSDAIEKYADTYVEGWDELQRRRLKSLKSRGFIPANVDVQPRPAWIPAWESLSANDKELAARDMAIYAGMIDRLDQNVGRLIDKLKKNQAYEDTLILVTSDNGPSKTTISDYLELDGEGAEFLSTFDNKLSNRGLPGSSVDLGPGWAYGLAAPLRLMKGYQSQGGVLSPLIVKPPKSWSIANKVVKAPVHVMDIMPTLLETAGANPSASDRRRDFLPMQGVSLVDLMQNGTRDPFDRRGFGGELFGIRSYRLGKWKILKLPAPYGSGEWQLYDLSLDPGETRDVASRFPERVHELSEKWNRYASMNGVVEPGKPVAYAKPPSTKNDR